jgi:hypothetical protein
MRSLSEIVSELVAKRDSVQKELTRLNTAISALRGANIVDEPTISQSTAPKPRRTMSASARRRIAAAQKARWAAFKAKQKRAA